MAPRLRVGVLLFKNNQLLLVKHINPKTGENWWVPPGGGVEGSEDLFTAAQREAFEEAGLQVKIGKPVYFRQLITKKFNTFDIYLLADIVSGKETLENYQAEAEDIAIIKEFHYFSQEELQGVKLFPDILKTEVWDQLQKGILPLRFLGVEIADERWIG